jgi:hypothetical protein
MQIDLLSNASATGAARNVAFGGRYLMALLGTLGGATITIEMLGPDGATYLAVPDSSLTAAGTAVVYLPANATVRGVVTGGTTPSGIYLTIYGIPA